MAVYEGKRVAGEYLVTVDGKPLPVRLDLRNHSPDGFNWSYGGSGPAQLALAILAYEFDDEVAQEHYQQFKWDAISRLPEDKWSFTSEAIRLWLERQGASQ
jgi:hypothetical protein